jgi:hypothetical protein
MLAVYVKSIERATQSAPTNADGWRVPAALSLPDPVGVADTAEPAPVTVTPDEREVGRPGAPEDAVIVAERVALFPPDEGRFSPFASWAKPTAAGE